MRSLIHLVLFWAWTMLYGLSQLLNGAILVGTLAIVDLKLYNKVSLGFARWHIRWMNRTEALRLEKKIADHRAEIVERNKHSCDDGNCNLG